MEKRRTVVCFPRFKTCYMLKMSCLLLMLLILRLGWSVMPQSGYIHPDEFFQTVEVVAGDALNISVVQTWEFTSSYPLRSVVLPQILFHPVFKLLKYAEENSSFLLTGYHLVTSYRLVMTVLSLWIDFCVYKICKALQVQGNSANILLASSYVTLTYQTHTFSNSFETLLLVTLFLLVVSCIRTDEENNDAREGLFLDEITDKTATEGYFEDNNSDVEDLDSSFNDLHRNAFNLRKRNQIVDSGADPQKDRKFEKQNFQIFSEKEEKYKEMPVKDLTKGRKTSNLYIYTGVMALVVTLGFFNRPTFVIFAFLPLFWWAEKHPTGEMYVFKRAAVFIITGIVFSFLFVIIDTIYFTGLDIKSLQRLDGWQDFLKNCVITPLNFILYNSKAVNLAEHGYHPFYLHSLVNMPILFGPMLLYLVIQAVKNVMIFLKMVTSGNENSQDKKLLSLQRRDKCLDKFRNDFSRMLWISIFFPVMSLSVFPHQEARFLIPILPLVVISVSFYSAKLSKLFWFVFIIFNIVLCTVFGMLHQGGVIPSLMKLQTIAQKEFQKNENVSLTLIYSHTYMPPKHVLLNQMSNLQLVDLKGSNFQNVLDEIMKKKISKLKTTDSNIIENREYKIFVCVPGSIVVEFKSKCDPLFSVYTVELFFPHLSFEDLPNAASVESLYEIMSLHLLEIE